MRRSWLSSLIIGGVLLVLTLFLGLQYRWLSAVGEAERDRMQRRAETDAKRLAEDFDREMQASYFNFQTPASIWKNASWDEFNARYDFWKKRTEYPKLVRDIYFFRNGERSALKYDPDNRAFLPADPSTD